MHRNLKKCLTIALGGGVLLEWVSPVAFVPRKNGGEWGTLLLYWLQKIYAIWQCLKSGGNKGRQPLLHLPVFPVRYHAFWVETWSNPSNISVAYGECYCILPLVEKHLPIQTVLSKLHMSGLTLNVNHALTKNLGQVISSQRFTVYSVLCLFSPDHWAYQCAKVKRVVFFILS